jgi:hypothetical protein
MVEKNIVSGTPPLLFLPAKNYRFSVDDNNFIIRIPRKGSYNDIAPDFFNEDDGEFNIYDEKSNTLYLPSITKVLFACNKYPDLEFNQMFIPYSLVFEEDEVVIIGQVVGMIILKSDEEENIIDIDGGE